MLGELAGVSISTIERVERGEKVSDENLDRIAVGLGYEPGYFTIPRRAIPSEQAASQVSDTFGHMEVVAIAPMRVQRKIREAANCHAFLIHRPEVGEAFDADIETLGEWLDLASFILSTSPQDISSQRGRRQLYKDILANVADFERSGFTILSGDRAPRRGVTARR